MQKFKNFVISFISIISILIFSLLLYLSYTTTLFNIGYDDEVPTLVKDNILLNIVIIIGIFLLCYLINLLINKFYKKINVNILMIITSIIMVGVSIVWVKSSNTTPFSDQYTCGYFAHYFNEGNYFGLNKGEYVGIYRQQLGLISYICLVFKLFGDYNFYAFQIINALSLSSLVISGSMIIRNIHFNIDKKKTEIYYLLLTLFCIPLYIYTDFVYGEILSIVFSFFTIWQLLSYLNKHKVINLILTILGGFIACFVRRNSIILIIAIVLILIVKLISEHNKYIVLSLMGIVLAGALSISVPDLMYKSHIPSDSKSMPATLHIAMGLHGEAGWYDSYNYETYKYVDYDPIVADKWARDDIKESLDNLAKNNKTLTFFYNKIDTQWNVPMFQCLNMNHVFNGQPGGLATSIYDGTLNKLFNTISNYYQLFIYTMCFTFSIYSFKNRKENKLEDYIFLVYIIGGFLFSIMWEAKARYILPYFVCMIPYCAIVISSLMNKVGKSRE